MVNRWPRRWFGSRLGWLLVWVCLVVPPAQAQETSRIIPFVNVSTTLPPATVQDVTVQLWDAAAGGTLLLSESEPGLLVDVTGAISFQFGARTAMGLDPNNFPSGSSRFIDVVDSTTTSVLPSGRLALNAAPFALSAGPQGPPGPQGPVGPTGPQGPPGVVQSVTAGNASIAVAGSLAAPTIAVAVPLQLSGGAAGSPILTASNTAAGVGVQGTTTGGSGVAGFATTGSGVSGSSGNYVGVRGVSTSYVGVSGTHAATTGTDPGVLGETGSTDSSAAGVVGHVAGTNPGGSSAGVRGINDGTGGLGIGVWGSQNGSGWGVYGTTPNGNGVYGFSASGKGVSGSSSSGEGVFGTSGKNGVHGRTASATDSGVWGENTGGGYGVFGSTNSSITAGVWGDNSGVNGSGVKGTSAAGPGVFGSSGSFVGPPTIFAGVLGSSAGATGVLGVTDTGVGVWGSSSSGLAGFFDGRVRVSNGNLFISHPNSLVITSPNGTCWQLRVSDTGALSAASVAGCS